MKLKSFALGLIVALFSLGAWAGANHDHSNLPPVDAATAQQNATQIVQTMVQRGVIEPTWKTIKAKSAEQKLFGGHPEWIVVFVNDAVAEESKRTLYVFLSPQGQYLAANYPGN